MNEADSEASLSHQEKDKSAYGCAWVVFDKLSVKHYFEAIVVFVPNFDFLEFQFVVPLLLLFYHLGEWEHYQVVSCHFFCTSPATSW